MLNWQIQQQQLELKYTWKISRNASDYKINSIINVTNGRWKGVGEAAPNIRYNETPEKMVSEFHRFVNAGADKVCDLHDLETLLNELKLPNALRFGIESAYIHYMCHAEQVDIYTFLGIQSPGPLHTSFSLPIMEVGAIEKFYNDNHLQRFARLKIKVNAETADELLHEVNRVTKQPLIIDGNEAWKDPDAVLAFMETLRPCNVALMEQPMPAGMEAEYKYLKPQSPYLLFGDESICDEMEVESIAQQFHGVNMKLMKAGGYLNGLRILNETVKHNLQTMIGCMVETTLGISSAIHLCAGVQFVDLDGFLIVKEEPFGLVKEEEGVLSITQL